MCSKIVTYLCHLVVDRSKKAMSKFVKKLKKFQHNLDNNGYANSNNPSYKYEQLYSSTRTHTCTYTHVLVALGWSS